jgi:hypothetical protein
MPDLPNWIMSRIKHTATRGIHFAQDTWDKAAHSVHLFASSREIQIVVRVFSNRLEFEFSEPIDIGEHPPWRSPHPHAPNVAHEFEGLLKDLKALGCTSFNRHDAHGEPWTTFVAYIPTHGNLPMKVVYRVKDFARICFEKKPVFNLYPGV